MQQFINDSLFDRLRTTCLDQEHLKPGMRVTAKTSANVAPVLHRPQSL